MAPIILDERSTVSASMIRQTPPHIMSTEERLDEVAEIMMRGVVRLKKRSGKSSLSEYLAGLQRGGKRSCPHKNKRNNA